MRFWVYFSLAILVLTGLADRADAARCSKVLPKLLNSSVADFEGQVQKGQDDKTALVLFLEHSVDCKSGLLGTTTRLAYNHWSAVMLRENGSVEYRLIFQVGHKYKDRVIFNKARYELAGQVFILDLLFQHEIPNNRIFYYNVVFTEPQIDEMVEQLESGDEPRWFALLAFNDEGKYAQSIAILGNEIIALHRAINSHKAIP